MHAPGPLPYTGAIEHGRSFDRDVQCIPTEWLGLRGNWHRSPRNPGPSSLVKGTAEKQNIQMGVARNSTANTDRNVSAKFLMFVARGHCLQRQTSTRSDRSTDYRYIVY